jgi:hypothetical protein
MARKNKIQVGVELQGRADALVSDEISLTDHRAVAEAILEKALREGCLSTALTALNIIEKLSKTDNGLKLRDASTWSSELVLTFIRHAANVISEEVARLPISLDEQADFTAAVAGRLDSFFRQSRNSPNAIKLLEHAKE